MAPATATTAAEPASPGSTAAPDAAQIAAGFRAIRAAITTLAGQLGYKGSHQNHFLALLGADLDDIEALRQFILRYPPASPADFGG